MPPARIIPPLQADERATLTGFLDAQRATLADRIRSTDAARVHFCHHTDVIHA